MYDTDIQKKIKYYFWLDEMIMDLWSEYLDLLISNCPLETCDNKLKMIDFYQEQINELNKEFTHGEAYEWWKEHCKTLPSQKMYAKVYNEHIASIAANKKK